MLRISEYTVITLLCGVLSGAAFAVAAHTAMGGMLVMFLPVLPLAAVGFSLSVRQCFFACLSACITIAILFDAGYILFFAVFIIFPLFHFVRKSLLWKGEEAARTWYPVQGILTEITLMSAGVFMAFALTAVHSEHIILKTLIAEEMSGQFTSADPEVAGILKNLVTNWSFVVFAAISWLWVLLFYGFVVLANTLLAYKHFALRPSLAITPEGLPSWLPVIVLISALLAFFGNGNDRFAGEVVFLIMLLPYFLSGIASVHEMSLSWPGRKFWLGMFYVLLIFFPISPWLFVLLIAKGFYTQIKNFAAV